MKKMLKIILSLLISLNFLIPESFRDIKADVFTVYFYVCGSTDRIESQSVAAGGYAVRPENDPEVTGYLFEDWYTDTTFTEVFDFENTPINSDTTIYAKMNVILYLLDCEITMPVEGEHPSMTAIPKEPDKYSVIVDHWYLDDYPYPDITPEDTFEADKYYRVRVRYTPAEGFAFDWDNTIGRVNGVEGGRYGSAGDIDACFQAKSMCTVTFVTFSDETADFTVRVEKGQTVGCPADPVKSGYAFGGWCANPEGTTAYEFSTVVTDDINVYASWKKLYYITFASSGGSEVEQQEVAEGYAAERPTDPVREGYVFKGWWYYDEGGNEVEYSFTQAVNSDLYLFAKWELLPLDERDFCIVRYRANGGTGIAPAEVKAAKGSEITLPECTFTPLPGAVFRYWTIISEEKYAVIATKIMPGQKYKVDEDIIIEPEWKKQNIRLAGTNRYDTAIKSAREMREQTGGELFSTVILTTGTNFADALGGGFLAIQRCAPILLTNEANAEKVNKFIKENLAMGGTIFVLGGKNAVSEKCLKGLDGFDIRRIEGANRYETNIKIMQEAHVTDHHILVCTGTNFADSLSASATGFPILLVNKELNSQQIEYLKSLPGNNYFVIGGTAAVSDKVLTKLQEFGPTLRIAGANRYETSCNIARVCGPGTDSVVLAYAGNYPDGLCGGPLAYYNRSPVILTATGNEAEAIKYAKEYNAATAIVLGGTGLISDKSVRKILSLPDSEIIVVK